MKKYISLFVLCLSLMSCGVELTNQHVPAGIPPTGPQDDNSIVRGVAVVQVESEQQSLWTKLFNIINPAYAVSTASTVVTYNNAPSVTFTINAATLIAGSFTGDTLSLGSFSITALKDNNLKICNPGGNTKCTTAIIRVYTTGATAGFINTSDSPVYGNAVYTTGDNPTTALPLNTPGVALDTLSGMLASKHKVNLSDFSPTTFNVTSDFVNGGSGSYSMTYVVEYALAP